MKNTNLPPFYVGQRVVAVKTYGILIKGNEYIVKRIEKKCKCSWWVDVGLSYEFGTYCSDCGINSNDKSGWHGHENFAPIETTFESISFKKVFEIESPLIGIN